MSAQRSDRVYEIITKLADATKFSELTTALRKFYNQHTKNPELKKDSMLWRAHCIKGCYHAKFSWLDELGIRSEDCFREVLTILYMLRIKPIVDMHLGSDSKEEDIQKMAQRILGLPWVYEQWHKPESVAMGSIITGMGFRTGGVAELTAYAELLPATVSPAAWGLVGKLEADIREANRRAMEANPLPPAVAAEVPEVSQPKATEAEPLPPPPDTPASLDSMMNLQRQVNKLTNRLAAVEDEIKKIWDKVANLATTSTQTGTELTDKLKQLSERVDQLTGMSRLPVLPPLTDGEEKG